MDFFFELHVLSFVNNHLKFKMIKFDVTDFLLA